MQELNLTIEQSLILIAILTPLTIFLWCHLDTYQLHSKPKKEPEGKGYQTADKCELRGLYPITGALLQLER